jgi:hypothetical protein
VFTITNGGTPSSLLTVTSSATGQGSSRLTLAPSDPFTLRGGGTQTVVLTVEAADLAAGTTITTTL